MELLEGWLEKHLKTVQMPFVVKNYAVFLAGPHVKQGKISKGVIALTLSRVVKTYITCNGLFLQHYISVRETLYFLFTFIEGILLNVYSHLFL